MPGFEGVFDINAIERIVRSVLGRAPTADERDRMVRTVRETVRMERGAILPTAPAGDIRSKLPPCPSTCPPVDKWFDKIAKATLTAGGETAGWSTVVSFVVPDNTVGVLRWFGMAADDPAAWDYVEWSLELDNAAIIGDYAAIDYPVGGLSASDLNEVLFSARGGQTFALKARNTHTSTNYVVYGRMKGFWYE